MTASRAPRDNYNAVWIIFFILGLGTLLPWNFFMTATMYFTSRLNEKSSNSTANLTAEGGESHNVLQSKFNNVMTLCAMVPLLVFTCLNSFIHQRIPQKLRISGSLMVIFVVFLLTAVFVKVDIEPVPFFTLTMIKIVCINSFGAVLQGSLFGLAGILPASYTTPIMSGQGLAGIFAAFSMICALATGSELQDSAFGYFITACVVILLAIVSYLVLPRMIWVTALSVCFIFTVTIGIFPAVTVEVKSTVENKEWDTYFIPVACFLLFNLMDWAGRSLTALCMWPGQNSRWLPALVCLRVVFIPLFMLCNVEPRHYLPVLFHHDAWYIIFMIFFSFSNGYLASLCMCFGPKKVKQHEAETAGAVMAFFLSLGLALGAALSFAFRAMV
uniref:Equilibrative nucleoside transporter 1-like n=1 Tax=Gouania willdenowi TaxID=441366 RepID=A0A8C5HML8_GOUWI